MGAYRLLEKVGKRGEERVKIRRKWIGILLTVALIAQVFPVNAAAAGTLVSGYAKDQDTVRIDITSDAAEESDFVTKFPTIVMEKAKKNARPSPDLVNQKRQEYVSVPLYYQTDYPDVLYGNGTVETSGCSITSMAMVASYLTGYEYLPDELAFYFGGRATNNIARLECAAEALGIPYERPENWHYTLAELKSGKIAIVLVGTPSSFTESQHFIVLTGMTEDGKILVNDAYAPNYDKWDLKRGFESGFTESEIRTGYQGAWVFDKSAMPEEITRYTEIVEELGESRYPEIELTFAERQLLARVIWVEARGESEKGQQAVAEVVFNRMVSDNFADNLRDVIYGEGQFRSVKFLDDAQPGQAQYQAIDRALYGPYVLPMDVTYFATYATNNKIWGTIGGHIFCYENDKVMTEADKQDPDSGK